MRVDVFAAELDRLHVRDLLDVVEVGATATVVVFNEKKHPTIAEVSLIQRGTRRWICCPQCGGAKMVLRTAGPESLGCNGCTAHLRPHQKKHKSRAWRHHQGAVENQFLRLATSNRRRHIKAPTMKKLARELCDGDHDRAAAALQHVDAALSVADETHHN